jgi:PAS domain S-box-containing protein
MKKDILTVFLFTVVYFLAHFSAFLFPGNNILILMVWPAVGIVLTALLLSKRKLWPFLILSFFITASLSDYFIETPHLLSSLALTAATIAESVLCALLIHKVSAKFEFFSSLKEILALIAGATLINAATGLIWTLPLTLGNADPFIENYTNWMVSNALGVLLMAPFFVIWLSVKKGDLITDFKGTIEWFLFFTIWVFFSYKIFNTAVRSNSLGFHPYMLVALLLWPAIRFRMKSVTLALVVMFLIAILSLSTKTGPTPFSNAQDDLVRRILEVYTFTAFQAMVGYFVYAGYSNLLRTETALRESEENLLAAQQTAKVGNWVWYIQENRLWWSNEMYNIFEIDKETFSGELDKVIENSIHPEDKHIVEDSNKSVIINNKPKSVEYRIILKDGRIKYVLGLADNMILDKNGKSKILKGIIKDITEYKLVQIDLQNAKEKAEESEIRFSAFMDNLPASTFIKDQFGRNIYFNKFLVNLMGFKNWENKQNDEIVSRDLAQQFSEDDKKALEGNVHVFNETLRGADGIQRIFQTIKFPIYIEKKGVMLGGIAIDITDIKKYERALEESEKRLNDAQHLSHIGNWELNFEQNRLYWSDELYNIVGLNIETPPLSLNDLSAFYPPDDYTTLTSAVQVCRESGTPYSLELDLIRTDKKIVRLWTFGEAKFNERNEVIGLKGIVQDITKQKKNEDLIKFQNIELQKLNADKDRFISILAHDLKSPFSSILGFSSLISKNIDLYDRDKIKSQVKIINDTALRTYNLLEDLLLWTKSQAGKLPFKPEKLDVFLVCSEIINDLQIQAENKKISLTCLVPEGVSVIADLNMFNTILRNLISNSIKFSKSDGKVQIDATHEATQTLITITDDGVGISLSEQQKLWNFASPYTTPGTANEKGSGLGLILCKEFVERHGGKIWVESDKGKGCRFRFTIPAQTIN